MDACFKESVPKCHIFCILLRHQNYYIKWFIFFHTTGNRPFYPEKTRPLTGEETFQLPVCFPQQMRFYTSYQCNRLAGTKRYNAHTHAHTCTHTHTLGWMGLPISRADCSPVLGCLDLSCNSVTHTPSFAVSGAYQPPSSQETRPRLPLFYLIMHLHTLANKPCMLKSATQTCAQSVQGACWQQGQKIVPGTALMLNTGIMKRGQKENFKHMQTNIPYIFFKI